MKSPVRQYSRLHFMAHTTFFTDLYVYMHAHHNVEKKARTEVKGPRHEL